MELIEAIKHALDSEAILFLGAGFSYGGTNAKGESMKVGCDLSYAICDDLGIERTENLTISSSRYIDDDNCKKGLPAFIDFLRKEVFCIETTSSQDLICSLPWKRIYTTNYDNIVELATQKRGIKRETITITNERYAPSRNMEQAIVHINGYINNLSEKSFYEEFKITDDNYNRDGLLQSEWKNLFLNDLSKEKAVIFIGYSLQYDQELVRAISNMNIKDKCIFIDIDRISADNEYKIPHYGTLYKIGVDGFASEINNILKTYKPKVKHIELVGFEKVDLEWYYSTKKYNVVDVVDFLIKGDFKREYLNQEGYCVQRKEAIAEVCKNIISKKVVVLQSKLGNGKTVFLECLANELGKDYNVYFVKNVDDYINDLQLIQSVSDKLNVILVDDYGYYIKLVAALGKSFPENLRLVLTCRTAININLYYDLIEKYHYSYEDVFILDLDVLNNNDIKELEKVLTLNRLWGNNDTLSIYKKRELIKKKYSANLSKVFYLLLDSEAIGNQIHKVVQMINEKRDLNDFVLAQAINSLCRLKFSYADLVSFVGISETLLNNYMYDYNVREVLDVSNHRFTLSSSIFAMYLIRQVGLEMDKKRCLETMYTKCSLNDEKVGRYKQQRKYLVSRSNIKLAFSEKNRLEKNEEELISLYYDSIKNLPTATDNPFFWLQFAITSLNLDNYELARIQFDNAYANADKMDDFDTYQIDTHYARMLLCSEMHENRNDVSKALSTFNKAHKLLFENRNTGTNLSYVLRQTSLYHEYFELYEKMMSDVQKEEYREAAFKMNGRYLQYFTDKELFKIPFDIAKCYLNFRKIFINTPYQVMLKQSDIIYNSKVPDNRLKIKY